MAIALPMTLSVLTTPLLGIVGMAVVGRLGDAALLAGLAGGVVVIDLCFATFNFLRSGTTGLVAQALGREDPAEEQAVLCRALAIALACGLVLMLLAYPASLAGAALIAPEADVAQAMQSYVTIRLIGAPLSFANFALLGYFLGRGEAMLGLSVQMALTAANIGLSILLGLVLGWGLVGVAWAAVAGEACGLAIGLLVVLRRFRRLPPLTLARFLDRAAFRAIAALNGDIMIRTFALMAAFTLFARQGAQFGTLTLAANAVLMNFFMVAGYFLDGLANAAEQIVGRAVGARYAPAVWKAIRLTALSGFVLALVAAAIFLVAGRPVIDLISTLPDVRHEAMRYLPWAALTAVSGVLAFQMDGVYIGATWSRAMRNRMLFAFATFIVAIMALTPIFGNHGLWAALNLFLLARGLSLLAGLPGQMRRTFR